MAQYAHPEMLVDTAAYDQGHISGAIAWNWTMQRAVQRQ
jgi:hypothetical protein